MSSYERTDVTRLASRHTEHPSHLIAVFSPQQLDKTTIFRRALESLMGLKSAIFSRFKALFCNRAERRVADLAVAPDFPSLWCVLLG